MQQLRNNFYQQGKTADANPATRNKANCWICEQRIDYDAQPGTTENSHELDHYWPVSTHPNKQEDPTNFRHSHSGCNRARGNEPPTADLGELVPNWW